jgi:hypothetical protein
MNYFLSLPTAKQLKEWGCDIESEYGWFHGYDMFPYTDKYDLTFNIREFSICHSYDLRDIICNKDGLEENFFTDLKMLDRVPFSIKGSPELLMTVPEAILFMLQCGEKESAEKYFLENTVWNPRNK